jgi:ectoine hydroxylase-related dioxygenase (phytanoyl-CoA dioxygenase family)
VAIWYQQYLKNSTHGWHTHSDNFTGVYYLEMDETAPKTQIINSNKILNLNVEEGDFVIFPSYLIHRAPINLSKNRKTIISFNFNVSGIRKDILDNFK